MYRFCFFNIQFLWIIHAFQHCFLYMKRSSKKVISVLFSRSCEGNSFFEKCHLLATYNIVIDKEQAIIKATDLVVPKLTKFLCWNHIFRDIQFWLQKRQAPARKISLYWSWDDISQMFHSSSEAEYSERLEDYRRTWDSAFHQYYI